MSSTRWSNTCGEMRSFFRNRPGWSFRKLVIYRSNWPTFFTGGHASRMCAESSWIASALVRASQIWNISSSRRSRSSKSLESWLDWWPEDWEPESVDTEDGEEMEEGEEEEEPEEEAEDPVSDLSSELGRSSSSSETKSKVRACFCWRWYSRTSSSICVHFDEEGMAWIPQDGWVSGWLSIFQP